MYAKTHNDRNRKKHSRNTALEQTVKIFTWWGGGVGVCGWGGGGVKGSGSFYVATTFALNSSVVYIRHLFSPHEEFLISATSPRT